MTEPQRPQEPDPGEHLPRIAITLVILGLLGCWYAGLAASMLKGGPCSADGSIVWANARCRSPLVWVTIGGVVAAIGALGLIVLRVRRK